MGENDIPENIDMSFSAAGEGIPSPNSLLKRPKPPNQEISGVSSKPTKPEAGRIQSKRRNRDFFKTQFGSIKENMAGY